MDRNVTIIGIVGCILLATIAWSTFQTEQRVEKLENAGRILMDLEDCKDRCPRYSAGDTGPDGHWKAADNSDHEKCNSRCEGETKQQFRSLLK